jgi:hypothetical protein
MVFFQSVLVFAGKAGILRSECLQALLYISSVILLLRISAGALLLRHKLSQEIINEPSQKLDVKVRASMPNDLQAARILLSRPISVQAAGRTQDRDGRHANGSYLPNQEKCVQCNICQKYAAISMRESCMQSSNMTQTRVNKSNQVKVRLSGSHKCFSVHSRR